MGMGLRLAALRAAGALLKMHLEALFTIRKQLSVVSIDKDIRDIFTEKWAWD